MKNSERKPFFRLIKRVLSLFISRPYFCKDDAEIKNGSIFICNHVGSTVPLKLELHFNRPFKFWGTYEMTFSFKERWKYLAYTYFYKKKHNPLWLAKIKASLANPFVGMFYKGMQLIPTYQDLRLIKTIKYSVDYLESGKNIVVFPENSSDGYHEVLKEYYAGFLLLAKKFYEQTNKDINIYNMYYRKKDNRMLFDRVYSISEIIKDTRDIRIIASEFKNRANFLANS